MDARKTPVLDEHRKNMIALGRLVNERAGIALNPNVTAEQVQAMMLAQGIRPEDNIFSRDIICQRESEWDE